MKLQYLFFALCLGFSACSSSTDPDDTNGDSDQTDTDGTDDANSDSDTTDNGPGDSGAGDSDTQCTALSRRCTGLNSIERCLPDGTWQPLGACDGACSNGECIGVCTPGSTGCCMRYADETISCTINTVEECFGANCVAGTDHGVVTDVFVGACGDQGQWLNQTPCPACTTTLQSQTIAHCEYCPNPTCAILDGCLSPCQ